jgi:hypothetical protein
MSTIVGAFAQSYRGEPAQGESDVVRREWSPRAAGRSAIMKRINLLLIIILPMLLGFTLAQRHTDSAAKQEGVVEFTDKTKLAGEILLGEYYFEHDDSRMARGEPCMYVYSYEGGKPGKLMVSFHCKAVQRPKARDVIVTLAMTSSPDLFLLKEIQFKGSTKGHLVPES